MEGWLEGLLVADYVQHKELAETRDGLGESKSELREFRREVTDRLDRFMAEMNQRFDRQAAEMLTFSNSVNERLDRQYQHMLVQTRWNVGLIGLFGTIFAVLYGIGQLKP